MWKLGNIEIKSKAVLAPMAGVTSFGYRKFMQKYGAEIVVTEMVSDMGILYENLETETYVKFPKSSITGVQLFGNDANNLSKALLKCEEINKNIDFYDVNMGCPVPKVTKNGSGSALMKNPTLCGEIIKALKATTTKPITAKIRLGWDDKSINFLEVIDNLVKAGVDAIAIHARTKADLYYGLPKYELLKDLQCKIPVPLIISGNIYTTKDAIKALEITKATAVMVARGGIGNPTLIKQINSYYQNGEIVENASIKEQKKYCLELADDLIEEKGEFKAMRLYRAIAPKFFTGIPNAKLIKNELATKLVSRDSLVEILSKIEEN